MIICRLLRFNIVVNMRSSFIDIAVVVDTTQIIKKI